MQIQINFIQGHHEKKLKAKKPLTWTLVKYWLCGIVDAMKLLRTPKSMEWNFQDMGLHYLIITSLSGINSPMNPWQPPHE